MEMCNWLNEKLEHTPSCLNHIWCSDEAHFHLIGVVNNHNNVFWGESSPEEIGEKHLKGPKVTAFGTFNAKHGLLGPYWFEENGCTVTTNSERYIPILDQFHGDLTQKLTQGHIGVARIIDWGGGYKPQITCNDVIRNFQKRNFLWGKDIVEWKIRSCSLLALYQDFGREDEN